jgi:hypothetical protein
LVHALLTFSRLQRCATVDVDTHLITDNQTKEVRQPVLEHLDTLAKYTGTDIFLLTPKLRDTDSAIVSSYGYATDNGLDQRFRVAIYGDMESTEHAKTRVLIMIDQIVSFFPLSGCPTWALPPLTAKSSNVTWTP